MPRNKSPQNRTRMQDKAPAGQTRAADSWQNANGHSKPNGIASRRSSNPKLDEKENVKARAKGVKSGVANLSGDGVLQEEYPSSDNPLTSTRPPKGYNSMLQNVMWGKDAPESDSTSKDQQLVSGRQAGQRWHRSAVRWAPLNVPLQRRLQTFSVLCHTLSIAALFSFFFVLAAIPLLWPILVPYLLYTLFSEASTSGELSHRSERLRRSPSWSLFASYFPARLHRSEELTPTRKYLFGVGAFPTA